MAELWGSGSWLHGSGSGCVQHFTPHTVICVLCKGAAVTGHGPGHCPARQKDSKVHLGFRRLEGAASLGVPNLGTVQLGPTAGLYCSGGPSF